MTKTLKDYENWFIKFKQSKKYWPEICDIEFDRSIDPIKKFIKKSDKEVYLKIDAEITSKKQDRATLTKAKRLAKGNALDAKYIDLRFDEIWDEKLENEIIPFLGVFVEKISTAQSNYEIKNKRKPLGGDDGFFSKK